ncbi:MAG: nucleotidyltransferase domain-containing protein [Leptolyngbyaceae bacterium]|nr:nucleotidyltransferase domain-containing protein [Leptolyngbyaceae bacterium]
MAKTALELTPEELSRYNPWKNFQQSPEAIARWEQAWELLPSLVALLREKFGATRVVVFGSLTQRECYTPWSDIDLVAWDIPDHQFYQAVGTMAEINPNFKVDLVDPDNCRPSVKQAIEQEGIEV